MAAQSLAYVKGWTRVCVAIYIAHCIISMDLVETVKTNRPVLWDSLKSVRCIMNDAEVSVRSAVMLNRGDSRYSRFRAR